MIEDDRKFVRHLLAADPAGWEQTRAYSFGSFLNPAHRERLWKTIESYPGD